MSPETKDYSVIAHQLQSQINSGNYGDKIGGTSVSIVPYSDSIDTIISGGGMMDREGTAKVVRSAGRSLGLNAETESGESTITVTLT